MPLYERLTRLGMTVAEQKIPIHQFMAAVAELKRGKTTQADVHTAFNLNAGEQTELTSMLAKIVQRTEFVGFGAYVVLTNIATTYDGTNMQRGLGFITVDMSGVTSLDFVVQVNKIGTGTQSWQLWDDTAGAQIGVIDDAGAAGNKTLTATFTPSLTGFKRLRVRAKSTVATDDPLFYGASCQVHRLNTLSGLELHDILMLAESQALPHVDSIAELKTRLGV